MIEANLVMEGEIEDNRKVPYDDLDLVGLCEASWTNNTNGTLWI